MDFTVNGQQVALDRAAVYAALKGQHPRVVGQQRYLVKIRKGYWPVVQAVQAVLAAQGHDSGPVPSAEARRVLLALGFQVLRKEDIQQ